MIDECNNIVDIASEMIYYDEQTDVVTVLSVVTYISGWRLGWISRVSVSGDVIDLKFITQGNSTIN